jgi:F-type H+-transporting ATPase subunit epsilon
MPLQVEVITPERHVFEDEVDMVVIPGSEGMLGILPHHAPLFTGLGSGEMRVKKGTLEYVFAVFGGFMDVRENKVTVLTDTAEHAEDIDERRAQEARDSAQRELEAAPANAADEQRARAALQRALIRLRVAERRRSSRRP